MKRRVTKRGKAAKAPRRKSATRASARLITRRRRSPEVGLREQLEDARRELRETREQQTATSEVLKVISSSPGELQPVFNAMLENATRICEATFGAMLIRNGDALRRVALHNAPESFLEFNDRAPLLRRGDAPAVDRAFDTKQAVQIVDAGNSSTPIVRFGGARTLLVVPMLKDAEPVGAIGIYRRELRPFTEKQIELVTNFATQALIAIENTRLLNELRESLQQQTATADVLKVISSSPGELQPVFKAMLENALHICEATFGILYRYDGERFAMAAQIGASARLIGLMQQERMTPHPDSVLGRIAAGRKVVEVADATKDPGYLSRVPAWVAGVEEDGTRSLLGVPMKQEDTLVGAFVVFRQEIRPFTGRQIELVQNFAAQAVIAIENTRLLNELRESLAQQTATADVLKVISRSTFDLPTVLNTLVESAARLCEADMAGIVRPKGEALLHAASFGYSPEHIEIMKRTRFVAGRGTLAGRTLLEGKPVHIPDVEADPEYFTEAQRTVRFRTMLGVPLLRERTPIGVLVLIRSEPRPFSDKQIELVETFADQAVIAIENVRLFDELQARTEDLSESLQQQTATADVLKVISRSTFDLKKVLDTLVQSAVRLCDANKAYLVPIEGMTISWGATYGFSREYQELLKRHVPLAGRGTMSGRVVLERAPVQISDVLADQEFTWSEAQKLGNYRTLLGVPLLRKGVLIGVLGLARETVRPFTDKQIELVQTFADQAVIAIENVRLFDEIQDKSRQLAEASQHKSQFLANMSHELRTPLNAILGYTELIADGIYGVPPEKMHSVLKRIESNGKHLLGLINAVLDLSKIEAGQLVIDLADYSLEDIVQTVCTAIEPLAADKKIALKTELSSNLPPGRGDERRLTQVLLNLVGNAIKFTDAGEVVIKAGANNESFDLSVRDTGPGISAADQSKLFQEFQQADNSITRKKGGTGLGLAISKRIIEMHGGRIWVESVVGEGSTFSLRLPVRVERQVDVD